MSESLRKKKGISIIGDTEGLFFYVHTMHLGYACYSRLYSPD
jgi:hypothetical protein